VSNSQAIPLQPGSLAPTQPAIAPNFLSHTLTHRSADRLLITIHVVPELVKLLFGQAALAQQKLLRPAGFDTKEVPLDFIEQQHYFSLMIHVKEFLLKFCVLNYLFKTMRVEKLMVAGEPTLDSITIADDYTGAFNFITSLITPPAIQEWRYLPFRAPKRKNYKDLDRQVEHFMCEELATAQQHTPEIKESDWVCISLTRTNEQGISLLNNFTNYFWMQISDEKVDNPLRDLLVGMKTGDTIITQNQGLQDYFSEQLSTNYFYQLTIITTIPHSHVCFEQIKANFKLKTKKDLLKKLIEVFSYRNDISQRRAMVEECLDLLLAKHPISVPETVVSSFQASLLTAMHDSPDYNVYRTQKEFYTLMHNLSQKLARETVFLDALAYHEKIALERTDIENYLNCIKRPRTKEFIYSRTIMPHHEGQSTLIPEEELMRTVLREKTINHVLYHLTKE
jgi:hypothetical protein